MTVAPHSVIGRLAIGLTFLLLFGQRIGSAQDFSTLRVVSEQAAAVERPQSRSDFVATLRQGAIVEVIDREDQWYWVLLDRNENGTRMPAWLAAKDVEIVAIAPTGHAMSSLTPAPVHAAPAPKATAPKTPKTDKSAQDKSAQVSQRSEAKLSKAKQEYERAQREYEELVQNARPTPAAEGGASSSRDGAK